MGIKLLRVGNMLRSNYDVDSNAFVDDSEGIGGMESAGVSRYYGTNEEGIEGIWSLPDFSNSNSELSIVEISGRTNFLLENTIHLLKIESDSIGILPTPSSDGKRIVVLDAYRLLRANEMDSVSLSILQESYESWEVNRSGQMLEVVSYGGRWILRDYLDPRYKIDTIDVGPDVFYIPALQNYQDLTISSATTTLNPNTLSWSISPSVNGVNLIRVSNNPLSIILRFQNNYAEDKINLSLESPLGIKDTLVVYTNPIDFLRGTITTSGNKKDGIIPLSDFLTQSDIDGVLTSRVYKVPYSYIPPLFYDSTQQLASVEYVDGWSISRGNNLTYTIPLTIDPFHQSLTTVNVVTPSLNMMRGGKTSSRLYELGYSSTTYTFYRGQTNI